MSTRTRRTIVRHYDRVVARSVMFLLLALYTATFVGLPDTHDAEISFQTTSALARRGSLALGGTPEADVLIERAGELGASRVGVREGTSPGEYYGWFGVGQAAVALPLYAAGRAVQLARPEIEAAHRGDRTDGFEHSEYFPHLFVGWRNSLLTALTAWLIVLAARRLGLRRGCAYLAGISYGLTTFAWPQARSWLSDVQGTFLLFAAFEQILRLREERQRLGLRPPTLVLIGLCLGAAVATREVLLPAALVLDVAAVLTLLAGQDPTEAGYATKLRVSGRRALFWLLVPQLLTAGVLLFLNYLRYGDPLETGYAPALAGGFFGYPPLQGAFGLLLSPGRGLLWLAPPLVLLIWGVPHMLGRRQRGVLLTIACVSLAVAAPIFMIQGWHGAWTYGPRYLLPLLPFAWLGVAHALERASSQRWLARLSGAVFCLGLAVQAPAVLVDTATYHQLATQAAPLVWEAPPELQEGPPRDAWLFEQIQYDWGFAAPWAHWRILRHRTAGDGEEFAVREIFLVDQDAVVSPLDVRWEGLRHFAWVDFAERLGGSPWPAALLIVILAGIGVILGVKGLDRAAD